MERGEIVLKRNAHVKLVLDIKGLIRDLLKFKKEDE